MPDPREARLLRQREASDVIEQLLARLGLYKILLNQ